MGASGIQSLRSKNHACCLMKGGLRRISRTLLCPAVLQAEAPYLPSSCQCSEHVHARDHVSDGDWGGRDWKVDAKFWVERVHDCPPAKSTGLYAPAMPAVILPVKQHLTKVQLVPTMKPTLRLPRSEDSPSCTMLTTRVRPRGRCKSLLDSKLARVYIGLVAVDPESEGGRRRLRLRLPVTID